MSIGLYHFCTVVLFYDIIPLWVSTKWIHFYNTSLTWENITFISTSLTTHTWETITLIKTSLTTLIWETIEYFFFNYYLIFTCRCLLLDGSTPTECNEWKCNRETKCWFFFPFILLPTKFYFNQFDYIFL